jgi:hypothetical protein
MKTTIKEHQQCEKPFPKLMVSGDLIVLFTNEHTGTVVHTVGGYSMGYWDDSWKAYLFKDFHGTVTLEND